MSERIKSVQNNTAAFIVCPVTTSFPRGVKLMPGLNNWPSLYEQEVNDPKICRNWPIFKQRMLTPVELFVDGRKTFGPSLTFLYEEVPDGAEGPQPPAVLPANEKAAIAIVDSCHAVHHKAHLERWSKTVGLKAAVLSAIQRKLNG